MKIFILLIVLLAFAGSFVQSIPLDDISIGSDVSLDSLKDDIEKILQKLEIEIPKDFKLPPGVSWVKLKEKKAVASCTNHSSS
jgi:hypothetical protein